MKFKTVDREVDGRWIAEVPGVPGVMAYGASREDACAKASALAQSAFTEKIKTCWNLTAEEYEGALHELSAYFENEPDVGSEAGARFETLVTLVEIYEARHFPVESSARTLADRLGVSPETPDQWGRDAVSLEDVPVGRERV